MNGILKYFFFTNDVYVKYAARIVVVGKKFGLASVARLNKETIKNIERLLFFS